MLIAASVGAELGLGLALLREPPPTATTAILLLPDPALPGEPAGQAADPDRFIQTELFVLNGRDLADEVARRLQSSTLPAVTAVQVGATDVVQVSASSSSDQSATRSAASLVAIYQERRREALLSRVDGSIDAVRQQLRAAAAVTPQADESSTTEQSAARAEYARLLTLQNQLELISEQPQETTRQVQAPVLVERNRATAIVRNIVIGLLLGSILGMLFVIAGRERRQRQ